MSEKQGNQPPEEETNNSPKTSKIASLEEKKQIESSPSQEAAKRRARLASPALTQIYVQLVPKSANFSPRSVFLDFVVSLVSAFHFTSLLQTLSRNKCNRERFLTLKLSPQSQGKAAQEDQDPALANQAALTLLKTLETAVDDAQGQQSNVLHSFLSPELHSVIPVLTSHSALKEDYKGSVEKIIQAIQKTNNNNNNGSPTEHIMDPSSFKSDIASSSIADRIALGSDVASNMTNLFSDIGPACTRSETTFRETLAEFRRSFGMDDSTMARLLFFFSNKGNETGVETTSGLSSSLLGSLLPGRNDDGSNGGWNLAVVQQVIARDYQNNLDWSSVARKWDFYDFQISDTNQFRRLLELYRAGAQRLPPISALTAQWQNPAAQCSLMEAILSVPASIYMCELTDAELKDAATAGPEGQIVTSVPNPRCWASANVLQCLLYLTEVPLVSRRVRDLFIKGLLSCPEVILCSLIRLSLNQSSERTANVGKQMKSECMRELIPLFFKPNSGHRVQNGAAACRRVWEISPNTFTAACFEGWRSTASEPPQTRLAAIVHIISIIRLLNPPATESALRSLLEGQDLEFSIALYFVLTDKANYQLKTWLTERIAAVGLKFIGALITYLAKFYQTAAPRSSGSIESSPLISLENMSISLQVLLTLDASVMSKAMPTPNGGENAAMTIGDSVKSLTEACVQAHPSIRTSLSQALNVPAQSDGVQQHTVPGSGSADDEIEEQANSYFQKMYTSEQSIGEVVEVLKRFKTSNDQRENEIFACMIRNLFDEYRFFSKYPERELRITGIFFGMLIKEQLVNSITLGIALRYVLEALRRPPSPPGSSNTTSSSGKMFRFGMFALEQFKERLHEWPQYCSHVVQIPHLKEGYADLVAEIEAAMADIHRQSPANAPSGTVADTGSASGSLDGKRSSSFGSLGADSLSKGIPPDAASSFEPSARSQVAVPDNRVAEFGPNLGRAVTQAADEDVKHEAPPDTMLDRVQFLINNVSPSNVEQKAQELKEMLEPRYFDWLGQYLVVKRISAQPNFHSLYLAFLDNLGDYGKGLIQSILSSVYLNIGKLLRSPKITTSTSERSLLKNLGSWLGQITIARNRPILQLMLDCKELLLQGYENGRLIAVTPFVAKILEGAKNSVVFRPPNPWVMGLLGVFRALYGVEDLKMNIKFEVEVLCKNLGIKLDDIPPRTEVLAKRIPPVKERNPDFNMKSTSTSHVGTPMAQSAKDLASPDAKTQAAFAATPQLGGLGGQTKSSGTDQKTVIPNLASYVTINPSLTALMQQAQSATLASAMSVAALQRTVPVAVDRAIREIIGPVVERSVTIACITAKEIVTKDFATEGDENKMHKAAQLMVANLAGSLALVTCRDPLRSSVSTHLRQLLTTAAGGADKLTEQEQNTIEQCVAIVATDNLDLGCKLIEKAATEKAVREVEESISQGLSARRKHREQAVNQPFYDMSVFGSESQRFPRSLPEPLRPQRGGLRPEQLRVYEAFQRMPRQVSAGPGGISQGALVSRSDMELPKGTPAQRLNMEALNQIAAKIDSSVTSLLSAAGSRAPEVTLSMLPTEHEVRQLLAAVHQVIPRTLSEPEKKSALGFAQSIFRRLYELDLSEPLRLEALVALLEKMNEANPQLGNDLGTWTTYAPTDTEVQRKLHRTVLLLLVRSKLVSPQELDQFLSSSSDNGRNPVWVEFSLLFIRTAFLERIAFPADFPKLMELMTPGGADAAQTCPANARGSARHFNGATKSFRRASGYQESKLY
jgi:CCR4-NOT transcription complex subunit 1